MLPRSVGPAGIAKLIKHGLVKIRAKGVAAGQHVDEALEALAERFWWDYACGTELRPTLSLEGQGAR